MAKKKAEPTPSTLLRFSEDHLWLRVEADRSQIGISDFGQEALGELIGVELPEIGDTLEKGEPFAQLESVRTLRELVAPVNGKVVAINDELDNHPALPNEDPYHEGWLIEVELDNEDELDELMASEEYEEFISAEKE